MLSELRFVMAGRISLQELQRLYEDPQTPRHHLETYLLAAPEKSRPFSPGIIPDPAKVETGISGSDTAVRAALVGDLVLAWERERRRRQFEEDLVKRPDFKILYMEGDSWFQFPVFIDELYDHLRKHYNVYCTSRAGDTIRNMIVEAPEYLRYLRELIHLRGLRLHGFVFSGAGNDVVGQGPSGQPVLEEMLRDYDPSKPPAWHLETPECDAVMQFIAGSYRRLLHSVQDRFAALAYPDLRIYLHGYDYVRVRSLPDGDPHRKPWAVNWTGDPLRARGFTDNAVGSAVMAALIDRLNETTQKVCDADPDRAVYVDLRGSVAPDQWADELHATSAGFREAAKRFRQVLQASVVP